MKINKLPDQKGYELPTLIALKRAGSEPIIYNDSLKRSLERFGTFCQNSSSELPTGSELRLSSKPSKADERSDLKKNFDSPEWRLPTLQKGNPVKNPLLPTQSPNFLNIALSTHRLLITKL